MVGGNGPPALGDYGGAGDVLVIADLLHGVDHVISILAQSVVGAGGGGRVGAVVIHGKAATHVQVLNIGHLARLGVDAGRLVHGVLNGPDICDLRADVKVNHLQAVYDTLFPQYLHQL